MKLKIEKISNLGLGIGFLGDFESENRKKSKIFVPKTAIGDEIEVQIVKKTNKFTLGKAVKILKEGESRQKPECEYFSKCGGCSLQHLKEDAYFDFKKNNILESLNRVGIDLKNDRIPFSSFNPTSDSSSFNPESSKKFDDILPVNFVKIGKKSRRRVNFQVTNDNKLGFFEQNSHNLVAIKHCLMLEEDLQNLIPKFQNLLQELPKNLIKTISICKFDNILDVVFEMKKAEISLDLSSKLAFFAQNEENINLNSSFNQKITPIFQKTRPQLHFDKINIDVPNGIFLQATKAGQNAITKQILDFISQNQPKNIADIYCGIGTYSFAILDKIEQIKSYEGSAKMVDSVNENAKKNQLNHKIKAFERDLTRNPLRKEELKNLDLAIINPPRSGAKAQILKLAESEIQNIIMVSCDLNSFSSDAKILIENGFKLEKLTAIDQFYYTSHIELVGIFTLQNPNYGFQTFLNFG